MSVEIKGGLYCQRCKKAVLAQRNVPTNVFGGRALLHGPTGGWRCPDCGDKAVRPPSNTKAPLVADRAVRRARKEAAKRRPPQPDGTVWACEKNEHKLDGHHQTCPLDGSPVSWRAL